MDNIQKFPAGNSFVTLGAGEMIQGATGADLVLGLIEMKVPFRRQQFSDAALILATNVKEDNCNFDRWTL